MKLSPLLGCLASPDWGPGAEISGLLGTVQLLWTLHLLKKELSTGIRQNQVPPDSSGEVNASLFLTFPVKQHFRILSEETTLFELVNR